MVTVLKNSHGVTIIELLVVMLLITIIAGFGIAQMQNIAARQQFSSDVDGIMDDFKTAQNWARNSILEQDPAVSVVAYQIINNDNEILGTSGYSVGQHLGDGNDVSLSTVDLTEKNITVDAWPVQAADGFEFKVPSGRTAILNGDPLLDESLVIVFRHTRLDETINVTIDPSGTISR